MMNNALSHCTVNAACAHLIFLRDEYLSKVTHWCYVCKMKQTATDTDTLWGGVLKTANPMIS